MAAGEADEDSLPCAAPAPLPPPPPRGLAPDPDVTLTPERVPSGSGTLRPRRKQVHFSLEPVARRPPKRMTGERKRAPAPPLRTETPPPASPVLAAPSPHCSLSLGAEVRAARREAFDAQQAAQELLRSSFSARSALEAKAGEGVNIPPEQRLYQGLVSLQVPPEELLQAAAQEKTGLSRHRPEGRQDPPSAGPELLAAFHPGGLFTEEPFLEVEGLPPLRLQLRARDPGTAFAMDRKLRQWDA